MHIYGAGIAGLLAGSIFQTATIYEAAPEGTTQHKAVLRFRSGAIGAALGIPFRKVTVRKGIWYDGEFVQPTIQLANWYAQKVVGSILDRSIWHTEPVERYIAPENLLDQLAARCAGRIRWNHGIDADDIAQHRTEPIVSTIPMNVLLRILGYAAPFPFQYESITVQRWRIPACDVHQTVYFPSPHTTLYRVSITGDMLIAEYRGAVDTRYDFWHAFGIDKSLGVPTEVVSQRFGKIAPIDEAWRKQAMYELSQTHNIYSLGRFGTWRNILLDDVLNDVDVIKRLINSTSYEQKKILSTL